jgi:hypothetical protein
MNYKQRRAIIIRAFVATGKDGEDGLIWYIDQLERGILSIDKQMSKSPSGASRRRARSRNQIDQVLDHWQRRERVLKEVT